MTHRTHSRSLVSALAVAGTLGVSPALLAQDAPAQAAKPSTTITIYSSAQPGAIPASLYRPTPPSMNQYNPWQGRPLPGYAVVKQERPMTIAKGRSTVQFTDVAALIDPTTVSFESLTAPATTRVLEQNFQFDLVSSQKMLERFVGKSIEVDGQSVTLLSAAGGSLLVKEGSGQIHMLTDLSKTQIRFPEAGSGLILKPTLLWTLSSESEGEQKARVAYQTEGITWWADYNIVFTEGPNANSGTLDVGAWVSILNQSGATYDEARLKLIAGDVHRAPAPGQNGVVGRLAAARAEYDAAEQGFEQKDFFEYHLYTLGRATTIPDNSTKQIELFSPARGVKAEKVLVYYGLDDGFRRGFPSPMTDRNFGSQGNKKVDTYLKFKNAKDDGGKGLGVPLPAGRVRVSKLDPADKSLEFIGEDVIDHTPANEDVLIKMGSAFDVVGERTQTDFSIDERAHRIEETIQIKLRNHKKDAVNVIVKENLYRWTNWEIVQKNTDFTKTDARTIQFSVRAEPEKEAIVTYKVRYTW
jgi:hypothetical protein